MEERLKRLLIEAKNKSTRRLKNLRTLIEEHLDVIKLSEYYLNQELISVDKLAKALEIALSLDKRESKSLAHEILNHAESDYILDNVIDDELRNVLYEIEETGIIKTKRDEAILYNGKDWRSFFWYIDIKKINDIIKNAKRNYEGNAIEGIYSSLPEDAWRHEGRGKSLQPTTNVEFAITFYPGPKSRK